MIPPLSAAGTASPGHSGGWRSGPSWRFWPSTTSSWTRPNTPTWSTWSRRWPLPGNSLSHYKVFFMFLQPPVHVPKLKWLCGILQLSQPSKLSVNQFCRRCQISRNIKEIEYFKKWNRLSFILKRAEYELSWETDRIRILFIYIWYTCTVKTMNK